MTVIIAIQFLEEMFSYYNQDFQKLRMQNIFRGAIYNVRRKWKFLLRVQ